MNTLIDIAIPTMGRVTGLSITLASILNQTFQNFRLLISDQCDTTNIADAPELSSLFRVFRAHGHEVFVDKNLPRRGMAEQRQFLLDRVESPYVMFLDDDMIIEAHLIERLFECLKAEECGFVGAAPIGLSYLNDLRPMEQTVELWHGHVTPEYIEPGCMAWRRYRLHNAANVYHVQTSLGLTANDTVRYKIAWVGGCVLYDTGKLRSVGGFKFWKNLPSVHCGEDVLAQLRVMARYGGCGILPSGVYHQELPTTLPDRTANAPEILPIIENSAEAGAL